MTLVDLLARNLKDWPKRAVCIVQDHDGEVWPCNNDSDLSREGGYWTSTDGFMIGSDILPGVEVAEDNATSVITRAEWQAAVDALNAPKVVEWDGVGLPPIGMASCEYLGAHKYDEWTVVNIFAHYGHTVFVDFGDGWRAEKDSSRFRPIRTAEQVAAEEIRSIIESGLNGNKTMTMVVKEIIEAGYRKQVAK